MTSTLEPRTQTAYGRPQLIEDLVFGVGMHRGEDTAHFLHKGFRVVAFEAQPKLVRAVRERFAAEISDGRVTIVPGAITEGDRDSVTFYKHSRMSNWGGHRCGAGPSTTR